MSVTTIRTMVQLARPYNAVAMLLSFGIGAALGSGAGWQDVGIGLVIIALLHSAGTLQNDIEDLAVDRANHRGGPLQSGRWSIISAKRLVAWLTLITALLALLPAQRVTHLVFVALLAGLAWLYNSRPVVLSHRPISSIAALGLYYGVLPLAYGFALGHDALHWYVLAFMGCWFVQRASISILKDYKDASGDSQCGKHTFYLRFGKKITARTSVLLGACGYTATTILLLYWLRPHGLSGLVFVMAGLLALRNLRWRLRLLGTSKELQLNRIFKRSFAGHNQYEAVLLLCLALS